MAVFALNPKTSSAASSLRGSTVTSSSSFRFHQVSMFLKSSSICKSRASAVTRRMPCTVTVPSRWVRTYRLRCSRNSSMLSSARGARPYRAARQARSSMISVPRSAWSTQWACMMAARLFSAFCSSVPKASAIARMADSCGAGQKVPGR